MNWLNTPETTRRNTFIQLSIETKMSAFAIEKDWWVTRTLDIIFQMDIAKHLVFKGGTSLSKSWHLIDRFSEDIDLAIDMEFFMSPKDQWTKKERTLLRKKAGEYSTQIFFTELQEAFEAKKFEGLEFKIIETTESDRDPRILEIYYPNLIIPEGNYMKPGIQIDVSCRSLREPYSLKTIKSIVDEHYQHMDFAESGFDVPTVNPERTLLEKLFLLHEEFHRPSEKMRLDRLSRHLYDVYQLTKAGISHLAITNKELYQTIVSHRHVFTKIGGVDYNAHNPKTLDPIPPKNIIAAWKKDYERMTTEMIYQKNPPSFEELITNLEDLKIQLNNLPWDFDLTF
jgi:predicted nucleotidyltransferase component of viral defense system